ncbi:helix-turn-helix transcriptional regulator [Marinomonas sp. FW-1]|uniref:helix-turn-helix domain-containing protein n=1 Tax=Marinomonas sp. FW-1 TaxID=2071621 RepID=UPI0010C05CEC|nr:helix-turn-helix transcriptional regulator [Marinomonas sp. FW-1]
MLNSSLYDTLPSLINSIGQQQFYDQVAYSIKALDPISNIRIVSYSKTNHPVFLGGYPMSEIDEVYCKSAYLLDPVYDMICDDKVQTEFFTLDSLVNNDDFRDSIYYDTFYQQLGWCNETNIVIGTNSDKKICIVYSTKDNDSSVQALNRELFPCLNSIKAAILTHERVGSQLQLNQVIEHEPLDTRRSIFEDHHLTKREKEIVELILTGLSSASIAEKCFVSEGTVKNHRKNIYRKLKIKSQAELFRKFIQ